MSIFALEKRQKHMIFGRKKNGSIYGCKTLTNLLRMVIPRMWFFFQKINESSAHRLARASELGLGITIDQVCKVSKRNGWRDFTKYVRVYGLNFADECRACVASCNVELGVLAQKNTFYLRWQLAKGEVHYQQVVWKKRSSSSSSMMLLFFSTSFQTTQCGINFKIVFYVSVGAEWRPRYRVSDFHDRKCVRGER